MFSCLIPAFVSLTSPSARQQEKLCSHIFSLSLVNLQGWLVPPLAGSWGSHPSLSPSLAVPPAPLEQCPAPCAALHGLSHLNPGFASHSCTVSRDCGPRCSWGVPSCFWRMVQKPPRVYKGLQVLCCKVHFSASIQFVTVVPIHTVPSGL